MTALAALRVVADRFEVQERRLKREAWGPATWTGTSLNQPYQCEYPVEFSPGYPSSCRNCPRCLLFEELVSAWLWVGEQRRLLSRAITLQGDTGGTSCYAESSEEEEE